MMRNFNWHVLVVVGVVFAGEAVGQVAPMQNSPEGAASGAAKGGVKGTPKAAAKGVPKGGPESQPSPEEVIERFDRDGDGKISHEEFQGPPNRFATIDGDQDGFLTVEEFYAARQGAAEGPGGQQPSARARKGAKGEAKRACTFEPVPAAADNPYVIDVYSPDCTFAGTTLFGDVNERGYSSIVEVDFAGRVIWGAAPDRYFGPLTEGIDDVERLPSGNTLFNVKHYGAVEVTREGKEVWRHRDNAMSHDVDRLPNGNTIFVRGWVSKGQDHVREVDPSGKLVWSWNGLAQYDKPPFADQDDDEGWIHVNSVTRLADGNTIISLRNFDRTVEVDGSGNVVYEVGYGLGIPSERRRNRKVASPHDPEVLPNGNILVALTGVDRIYEVTKSGRMVRLVKSWPSETDRQAIRDVNLLPNGNILVVGYWRIFELSPDGEIVWSLHKRGVSPTGHSRVSKDRPVGVFYKAQRVAPDGTAYGG